MNGRSVFPLAAALMLTVGCGNAAGPTQPSGAQPDGALGVAPPAEGASIIAAVKRATAAFHDVDKAIAAGYMSPTGLPCDEIAIGAMGVHAANQAHIAAPGSDPLQPEVLLYLPTGAGGFRLIGVEYLQPVILRNTETGQVGPWFPATPWPPTYVIVGQTPTLFGETFQGPMPGHVPGMPWHYDLHVWAWAPNPNGTFAQWNPAISCPE